MDFLGADARRGPTAGLRALFFRLGADLRVGFRALFARVALPARAAFFPRATFFFRATFFPRAPFFLRAVFFLRALFFRAAAFLLRAPFLRGAFFVTRLRPLFRAALRRAVFLRAAFLPAVFLAPFFLRALFRRAAGFRPAERFRVLFLRAAIGPPSHARRVRDAGRDSTHRPKRGSTRVTREIAIRHGGGPGEGATVGYAGVRGEG